MILPYSKFTIMVVSVVTSHTHTHIMMKMITMTVIE
jgi:hypothetical protein